MGKADFVVQLKECDLCRMEVRIISEGRGRETAYDAHSGEEHDCWDLPPNVELLVIDEGD